MARGKKEDNDKIKEQARALLLTDTVSSVARKLGKPWSTIKGWREEFEREDKNHEDTFVKLREKKKKDFIEDAWAMMGHVQTILERRLARAAEAEDKIDKLLDEIESIGDEPLTDTQRRDLYKRFSVLKIEDVRALGTLLGVLYDKQALAGKEATAIVEGDVAVRKFEDL